MSYKENEIILVNPTGGWESRMDTHYFYPIGLLYLRNYLLKHSIPSSVIDASREKLSVDTFMKQVGELKPRIIGFTGSPFERHTLHSYIRGIKKIAPHSLVVVGGPYFTATAKECLEKMEDVDVVVRGEGEKTFLELVRAFNNGIDFASLKGITYRGESGEIIEKENNSPCNRDDCEIDIENLPDDDNYSPFVTLKNFEREKVKALPVLLARGCTMRCTFCFNNNNGRFLSRTVQSVVTEIKAKRKRFDCDYFWFVDPTFTIREKFVWKLCTELKNQCPGIKWYCETRADCTPELLKLMAEAGCISIDVALESGSPKVLQRIRKDINPEFLVPFTKLGSQLGIRILVFVMYGLPEEEFEDFLKTIAILKRIKPYIYTISSNQTLILPGTRMEAEAREENIIPRGFSWYDPSFGEIPRWKSIMSDRELAVCKKRLFKFQYLLHHSWFGYLKKAPKFMIVSFWIRSEKFRQTIVRIPLLHRFLKAISRIFLGKEAM